MKRRPAIMLLFSMLLAISGVMCSLGVPGLGSAVTATPVRVQETTAALQATLDWLQKNRPTATVAATSPNPTELPTEESQDGSIAGELSYPAEALPPLRIVAFRVGSKEWHSIEIKTGRIYQINDLPVGRYTVVAYPLTAASQPGGIAGGYTRMVPCGLSVQCTDHALIEVEIKAGEITTGINPGDWYAPEGSFPKDPTQ